MRRFVVRLLVGAGLLIAVPYLAYVQGWRQTEAYFRFALIPLPSGKFAQVVAAAYGCWALGLGCLVLGWLTDKRRNP